MAAVLAGPAAVALLAAVLVASGATATVRAAPMAVPAVAAVPAEPAVPAAPAMPVVPAAPATPHRPEAAGIPAAPAAIPSADPTRAILDAVPGLTAAAFSERLGRKERHPAFVLLDVRTAEEYAAGHIPDARNIAHDQLAARVAELPQRFDQEIVVYCRSGRRAANAIETLRAAGYRNLTHLRGDYLGWQAAHASPAPGAAPK